MKKLLLSRLTQQHGCGGVPLLEIDVENPVGWGDMYQGQMMSPTVLACANREHAEALACDQARSWEDSVCRRNGTTLPLEITGIVDKARFSAEQTPEDYTIKIPGFGTDKAIESVYWMSLDLKVTTARLREIAKQLTQTPPKPSGLHAYEDCVFGYISQFSAYSTYGSGSFLRPGDSRFRKVGKVKVTLDASNIIFQDADLPAPEHQLKLLFRHDVFPKFVSVIVQAAAKTDVWARLMKVG